jgi:hypothetical protein
VCSLLGGDAPRMPGRHEPGINDLSTTHPCESTAAAKSDHSRPGLATAGDDAGQCAGLCPHILLPGCSYCSRCYSLCHLTIPGQLQRPDASSNPRILHSLRPLRSLSTAWPVLSHRVPGLRALQKNGRPAAQYSNIHTASRSRTAIRQSLVFGLACTFRAFNLPRAPASANR